jgi:hypothetical protein
LKRREGFHSVPERRKNITSAKVRNKETATQATIVIYQNRGDVSTILAI